MKFSYSIGVVAITILVLNVQFCLADNTDEATKQKRRMLGLGWQTLVDDENLFKAKAVRCNYSQGVTATWSDLGPEESGEFSLENEEKFTIDAISVETKSARLITDKSAENIYATENSVGLVFIKNTILGQFDLTSIFTLRSEKSDGGNFMSVKSVHWGMGSPKPRQLYGTCKILEYYQ